MEKAYIFGLSLVLLATYSCGADPLYIEESDVILTLRAEKSEFSGLKTYVMPDEVIELCVQPESGSASPDALGGAGGGSSLDPAHCFAFDHSADPEILGGIDKNMKALGFKRLPLTERDSADVALLPAFIAKDEHWQLDKPYCYPDYFFPGCVEPITDEEYVLHVGSVLLQWIDLHASSATDLTSRWVAGVQRLHALSEVEGSSPGGGVSEAAEEVILSGINKAYSQSKYLGGEGQ